jgi:hypothetical protein
MGFCLFCLTSAGVYNGKVEFLYNGVGLYLLSLVLFYFTDEQIKGWLSKALNTALKFFTRSAPILLVFLFVSCGVIKNVKRDKEKTKTELDSVASSQVKAEVAEKEKTKTVITEKVDTSATVKGSTVSGSTPLTDLSEKPYVLQDENQTVTVSFDQDGKLKVTGVVKDREAKLQFEKRTEKETETDRKTKTRTSSQVKKSEETETKTVTTDKHVERSPWGGALIVLILFILALLYTFLRRHVRGLW